MKGLLKFMPVVLLAMLLVGCGGDDEMNEMMDEEMEMEMENSNSIEGEWTATFFEADIESVITFQDGQTNLTNGNVLGSDFSYDLMFEEDSWTTNGTYSSTATISVDGQEVSTGSIPVSNVEGSGDYSIDGSEITLTGTFFEVELNGTTTTNNPEAQSASFEINSDGQLVFRSEEIQESNEFDVNTKTIVVSTSIWERK